MSNGPNPFEQACTLLKTWDRRGRADTHMIQDVVGIKVNQYEINKDMSRGQIDFVAIFKLVGQVADFIMDRIKVKLEEKK